MGLWIGQRQRSLAGAFVSGTKRKVSLPYLCKIHCDILLCSRQVCVAASAHEGRLPNGKVRLLLSLRRATAVQDSVPLVVNDFYLCRVLQRKRRLDDVCCELEPQYSKNVVQGFIALGKVFVNGQQVTKAGHQVYFASSSSSVFVQRKRCGQPRQRVHRCVGDEGVRRFAPD